MDKDEINDITTNGIKTASPSELSLDRETLLKYLPKGSSKRLTDELLQKLNNVEMDTGVCQEVFNEQLCSYSHLIGSGVSIEKLANAIKFVNLRLLPKMGNAKAYRIVFPEKTKEIEGRGQSVDSFASMYNGSKLVTEVQKLIMVPVHITYAPVHNAMIKKLFDLTNGIGAKDGDYVSPTVQMNAATELLKATAQPEENKLELKVGINDEAIEAQKQLTAQLAEMAALQMKQYQAGRELGKVQRLGVTYTAVVEEDE